MKKVLAALFFLIFTFSLQAQKDLFTTMTLSNGMNVVLCEDHSQPLIYGAVCVHVGSKNEPLDNTGLAHYFEHIMFKGTDKIGTLDWNSEKVYLDSISLLYDQLHEMTDPDQRNSILLHINRLSNKSAEYSIPNEVDVILEKMGGKGINAFTSYDVTCYHNYFPSNQLEKWLMVYAERFRNPVFRLFQSELETVYEEYNRKEDNFYKSFIDEAFQLAYGSHPYGRRVIGLPEHLKNPQPSAMQKFFNTYYHPANMTLILVGDLDASTIKPLLDKTIGNFHNEGPGVNPILAVSTQRMDTKTNIQLTPFCNHQIITINKTPYRAGVIFFQTQGALSPNDLYLDIIRDLLNNNSETGLLDKLINDKKILYASAENGSLLENGMFVVTYTPNILIQSHRNAESLLMAAIDSLKRGHFDDDLLEAVKINYLKKYLTNMESMEGKYNTILKMVRNQQSPASYYEKEQLIRALSKEDIMKVAQDIFGDNCLLIRSNMGSPKHNKMTKPNWQPIAAHNTDAQSEFAKNIEDISTQEIQPQIIDFQTDVVEVAINDHYKLYASPNPYNDIFTLDIVYYYGQCETPNLSAAIDYISQQGSQNQPFSDFQLELQKLGATLDIKCDDENTTISISGFDKNMKEILQFCFAKLKTPENNEKILKNLITKAKSDYWFSKNHPIAWFNALYNYATYKERSPFLMPYLFVVQNSSGNELLDVFNQTFDHEGHLTYVGNIPVQELVVLLKDVYGFNNNAKKGNHSIRKIEQYDKPTIYIASNHKFLQSNIYFLMNGNDLKDEMSMMKCYTFNEYLNGGMDGVIFQEIRELRSFGYSTTAGYSYDVFHRIPGYTYGYLGTQSDKTVEGVEAMGELLMEFPERPEKFDATKTAAIRKLESSYISFRSIPEYVQLWKQRGYISTPIIQRLQLLRNMTYEDMKDFHTQNIANHPMVIAILGNKHRYNLKELSRHYQVIEMRFKDIWKK